MAAGETLAAIFEQHGLREAGHALDEWMPS
jgi:hypothetical protein